MDGKSRGRSHGNGSVKLQRIIQSQKEHIKFSGDYGEGEPPVEAGGLQAEAPWMAKAEAVPWERVGKVTKCHPKSKRA